MNITPNWCSCLSLRNKFIETPHIYRGCSTTTRWTHIIHCDASVNGVKLIYLAWISCRCFITIKCQRANYVIRKVVFTNAWDKFCGFNQIRINVKWYTKYSRVPIFRIPSILFSSVYKVDKASYISYFIVELKDVCWRGFSNILFVYTGCWWDKQM